MGVVLVSHHLDLVARRADRLAFLDADEHVAAAGTVAEVLAHPAFVRRYGALRPEAEAEARPPPSESAARPR